MSAAVELSAEDILFVETEGRALKSRLTDFLSDITGIDKAELVSHGRGGRENVTGRRIEHTILRKGLGLRELVVAALCGENRCTTKQATDEIEEWIIDGTAEPAFIELQSIFLALEELRRRIASFRFSFRAEYEILEPVKGRRWQTSLIARAMSAMGAKMDPSQIPRTEAERLADAKAEREEALASKAWEEGRNQAVAARDARLAATIKQRALEDAKNLDEEGKWNAHELRRVCLAIANDPALKGAFDKKKRPIPVLSEGEIDGSRIWIWPVLDRTGQLLQIKFFAPAPERPKRDDITPGESILDRLHPQIVAAIRRQGYSAIGIGASLSAFSNTYSALFKIKKIVQEPPKDVLPLSYDRVQPRKTRSRGVAKLLALEDAA